MRELYLGSYGGPWYVVNDPEQARLLTDAVSMRHLRPFLGRERGVAQAAREADVRVDRMLYRVRRFVRAGLLREVREQRRAGRPVKVYRTVADAFHVPFHLTPHADLEEALRDGMRPHETLRVRAAAREMLRLGLSGRLIYRDDDTGSVHSETALPDGVDRKTLRERALGGDFSGVMWLDADGAAWLAAQIEALREQLWARQQEGGEGRPFLVQVALTPLEPGDVAQAHLRPGE